MKLGKLEEIIERTKVSDKKGFKFLNKPIRLLTYAAMLSMLNLYCGKGPTAAEEEKHFWELSGLPETYITSLVSVNNTVLAGTIGDAVRVSYNNGKDWEAASFGGWYSGDVVNTMAIGHSEKNTIWVGSEVDLFRIDPYAWKAYNQSIENTRILSVAQDNSGVAFASGIDRNDPSVYTPVFLKNTAEGFSWKKITVKHPAHEQTSKSEIFIDADQTVYTGGLYRIFISSDQGENWTWTERFYPDAFAVSSIVRAPNGDLVIGAQEGGILYSENNGQEWHTSSFSSWEGVKVYDLVVSDHLYAGTNKGVLLSDDNGKAWTELNDGLETEKMTVSALTLNSGYLFAGTDHGVFRSTESQ